MFEVFFKKNNEVMIVSFINSGFDKDTSKSKYEVNALIPKLKIVSKYIVDGKVLILPITGRGDSVLNLGRSGILYSKRVNIL